jgi:hypothetical protein
LKNSSHGIRLPDAYLEVCEFEVREEAMNSAPSLDMGVKKVMNPSTCVPATGKVPDVKISCAPRLRPSDLDDPTRFHHRLVEWLMQQK